MTLTVMGESRSLVRPLLHELREHIADTPRTSKLIPLDNWAAMAGLTKGRFVYALQMEDQALYDEYQKRLSEYFQELHDALMAAPSSRLCDLESIAEKYQVARESLQAVARRLGRNAPSRKTILAEKIAKVAKVGMTVKELAAAAGLHAGSLKSAKNLGRLQGFLEFEVALRRYPSGARTPVCVVSWVKEVRDEKRKSRASR